MAIDFTKPVRTKGGNPVRILCTDRKSEDYPVIGLVTFKGPDGSIDEGFETWTLNGKVCADGTKTEDDLENIPEKVTKNIVFYKRVWDNNWHYWGEIEGKTEQDFRDVYPGVCRDVKIRVTPIEFDA